MHHLALCMMTVDWSQHLLWLLSSRDGRCFDPPPGPGREPSLRPIFDKATHCANDSLRIYSTSESIPQSGLGAFSEGRSC